MAERQEIAGVSWNPMSLVLPFPWRCCAVKEDRNLEGNTFTPSLLKEVRNRFAHVDNCPLSGRRLFLDSASGSLRLKQVVQTMCDEGSLPDQINRNTQGSRHVMDAISRGEDDVRLFLGSSSGVVVAALTATLALFRAIRDATAYFEGSNVVTTALDHPATYDSLFRASQIFGKEFRVAAPCLHTGAVEAESLLEMVDKNTSVLAFIHGVNITGAYNDASAIVREARSINEDICVIIDGVQYAPYSPLDLDGIGADVYVFAPYKTYSKKGIGFAVLSERFARIPHDRILGKREDSWELGSADHINYLAWSDTVDYLSWLGSHFTSSASRRRRVVAAMAAIQIRIGDLLERTVNGCGSVRGLKDIEGVSLHGLGGPLESRSCVVPMTIKGKSAVDVAASFQSSRIVVQARASLMSTRQIRAIGVKTGEIVRMSAGHYTSYQEIDEFLLTSAKIAEECV